MLSKLRKLLFGTVREKRREPRYEVTDGTVQIHGETYPVNNWSSRGFLASSYAADCKVTERVGINFSVPLADRRLEFSCRAIVLRIDKDKQELVGIFAMLDEATQTAIAQHFDKDSS